MVLDSLFGLESVLYREIGHGHARPPVGFEPNHMMKNSYVQKRF